MLSAAAPAVLYADSRLQSASTKNVWCPQACHCLHGWRLNAVHRGQDCCMEAAQCRFVPQSSLKLPHLEHVPCLVPCHQPAGMQQGHMLLHNIRGHLQLLVPPTQGIRHSAWYRHAALQASDQSPANKVLSLTEAGAVPAGVEAEPRAAGPDTHVAPGTPAPDAGTVRGATDAQHGGGLLLRTCTVSMYTGNRDCVRTRWPSM